MNANSRLGRISHYDLLGKVGAGGMGTVYRAADTRSGAVVAIKVMHDHLAEQPEFVRRFRREARIVRSLDSQYIVRLLDSGEEHGVYFLVMEYVDGQSLAQRLASQRQLPADEALAITDGVGLALRDAYRHGVVHRDITPQNILIDSAGNVKVSDFGIARDLADGATLSTAALGKPYYASPDQWAGRADIRSDIYSLGIVLYQMLAGSVPFQSDDAYAVMRMHEQQTPTPISSMRPDIGSVVEDVVASCLAKRPEDRFQTPDELLAMLGGINRLGSATRARAPAATANPATSSRPTGAARPRVPHQGAIRQARAASPRRPFGGARSPFPAPRTVRRFGLPILILWLAGLGIVLLLLAVVAGAASHHHVHRFAPTGSVALRLTQPRTAMVQLEHNGMPAALSRISARDDHFRCSCYASYPTL